MKKHKIKPGLYAIYFQHLKDIAENYGYNLLIHGSLNRDLDLVMLPWRDNPVNEQIVIKQFQTYLTGKTETRPDGKVHYTTLPGNRHCYVIELNRGNKHGEWVRFEDEQFYIDISVFQLNLKPEAQDAGTGPAPCT